MRVDEDKRALRALLDAEPADQRVQTRRALLRELAATRAAGDATKEREIGGKLAAITKEIQAAAAEQRAMMLTAIERAERGRRRHARRKAHRCLRDLHPHSDHRAS